MTKYFYIFILLFSISDLFCQQPGFIKVYNEHQRNQATYDDILIYSISNDLSHPWEGIRFTKYDKDGNEIMTNFIGDSTSYLATTFYRPALIKTKDGGYAMYGSGAPHSGFTGKHFSFLIKVDHNLNLEYLVKYRIPQGTYSAFAEALIETDDGFLLLGRYGINAGDNDRYIIKTDKNGKKIQQKRYGNNLINESFLRIKKISKNNYVACGGNAENNHGSQATWDESILISINNDGDIIWRGKQKKEAINGGISDFILLLDSSWLCASGIWERSENLGNKFGSQPYVFRMDKDFNVLWGTRIGVVGFHSNILQIEEMHDGNFIVSGTTEIMLYIINSHRMEIVFGLVMIGFIQINTLHHILEFMVLGYFQMVELFLLVLL